MDNEGELDTVDLAELARKRMNIKISAGALVSIPLDVVRVGVDDISLADRITVDLDDDFQIGGHAVIHIEFDSAPAYAEGVFEIVGALEVPPQFAKYRSGEMFCYLHVVLSRKTDLLRFESHQIAAVIGHPAVIVIGEQYPGRSDA